MEMVYSASNNSFFAKNDVAKYEQAGWELADIVEVTYDTYLEFIEDRTLQGKVRIAGDDGHPAWGEIPPPTHEEQIAAAELEKQQLINQVNGYINSKQWPGKAAIGRLKGEELAQYNLWLDYLDALELVDTSGAPDIEWPTPPAVQAR
ncbi:tail fiber assembly protein [Escherichia coli]|uniref:tail fiber assembly protein n=1 Tax=Escherichia coli TaxID=562 RepID=UPI001E5B2DDB|nr:tail fiber assembly protein [Escherichia coli]MCC9298516.1 tail fiber assembly protein [Escherichia coli]MCC9302812.1 tail fiber assembly protein [Escherichia coli]MCZ0412092.1 tail fiber assembly protein [Escherichia coli]UIR40925.1 tail fiber assembly protein [Escherichia coli]UUF69520.1 tail fiber assembly protein [Escherichia coli]